jgi:hypothetical protein
VLDYLKQIKCPFGGLTLSVAFVTTNYGKSAQKMDAEEETWTGLALIYRTTGSQRNIFKARGA